MDASSHFYRYAVVHKNRIAQAFTLVPNEPVIPSKFAELNDRRHPLASPLRRRRPG
jgi:hypothetical protein